MAQAGWSVQVFEQHSVAGGLMQGFHREGHYFDSGFHFITGSQPNGIMRSLFTRLGIQGELSFLEPSAIPFVIHQADGSQYDIPAGTTAFRQWCVQQWPETEPALIHFFAAMDACLNTDPWRQWLTGFSESEGHLPALALSQSAQDFMEEAGLPTHVQSIIGSLCIILGMRIESCPFDLFCAVTASSIAGAYRVEGGGTALTDALVRQAQALGVQIHLRNGMQSLCYEERVATGIIDERGVQHSADMMIMSCHPSEFVRCAGTEAVRPSFAQRIDTLPDSCGAFFIHALLDEPVSNQASHHILQLSNGWDGYLFFPHTFVDGKPSLEIVCWLPTERTADWSDSQLGKRPETYQQWKENTAAKILESLEPSFPGLHASLSRMWTGSSLTIQSYTRSRNGAAMGLSHDVGAERIVFRSRLRNCYFTGHNISHPGIMGSMVGALELCERVKTV